MVNRHHPLPAKIASKALHTIAWLTACVMCMTVTPVRSQTTPEASSIVEEFNAMLNYGALPQDSVLYIKTNIVQRGMSDTLVMHRWYAIPQYTRIEIRHKDTLITAYYGDGKKIFRAYDTVLHKWKDINNETYINKTSPYDFHGPLYYWKTHGIELHYDGEFKYEGQPVHRIYAHSTQNYDRYYLFEKERKLMFLYTETDSIDGQALQNHGRNRIDWHAYMEYRPIGKSLFVSQESYQYNSTIVFIYHDINFIDYDLRYFQEDILTSEKPNKKRK